ncbi:hypothetical protein [Streptomyces sp. 6N223]|uniref:hypothetical protein n=1 Tax=Streptomyces sp. 6N223 TaxID=3457412 RepID=UPI003FD13040
MKRDDLVHAAVGTALAAWLVATAANQLPDSRFDRKLRVPTPNWRFFGPNPGVKDTHLLYRDTVGERPTDWTEIEVTGDRPWYALAWNAKNRAPKVLFDTTQVIVRAAGRCQGDMAVMRHSPGYLVLERYLRAHVPHAPGATSTQFMLLNSNPVDATEQRAVEPTFASEWIPLPPR